MSAGAFIKNPNRQVKLMVVIHAIWIATIVVLILWWGTLLNQQGEEIANLQAQLGVPEPTVQSRLERTQMMIAGESGTFLFLILLTNSVLIYLFVRDTRRSKSIQAFFASLTHELRTPLTSIRLQAEALKDIEDDPKHRPFIDRLLQDVDRLDGQVQRSLELARIEGGGQLKSEPISIKNFIQSKVLSSYVGSEERVRFDVQIQDAFILAEPTALGIIFRNMIDNAVKYSASLPAQVKIQGILPSSNASHYQLHLIHENSLFDGEQESLGALFYRGRNSQGAGVGLFLIQTLTQKMGGSASFKAATSRATSREPTQFMIELTFKVDTGQEPGAEHGR